MPQLYVLAGRDAGRSFELEPGALLGRGPDCDLRLHDRSVSRRHARVEQEGERWFLVDLGSRNGLRVEGRRVERCELSDFGEVVLGELPLRFRADPETSTPPVAAAQEVAAEDEIELEEEIDLGVTLRARQPAKIAARKEAPPELSERDRARARILSQRRSGGLLSGDLAQRPVWVQAVVVLILLALASGLFLLAYRMVGFLRGTS